MKGTEKLEAYFFKLRNDMAGFFFFRFRVSRNAIVALL